MQEHPIEQVYVWRVYVPPLVLHWGLTLTAAALLASVVSAVRSDHFARRIAWFELQLWPILDPHDHTRCLTAFYEFNRCIVARQAFLVGAVLFGLSSVSFGWMSVVGRSALAALAAGVFFAAAAVALAVLVRIALRKSRWRERLIKAHQKSGRPVLFNYRTVA